MNDGQAVKALRMALGAHLNGHGARLTLLAQCILALLQARSVNLAALAPLLSTRAKPSSNYLRLQRFLRTFAIDQASIARTVTRVLPLGERWVLTLDRTHWKLGRAELNVRVLAVAYQGLALPLFWTALGKAGNSSTAERIVLMERFLATFGAGRIAYLLADREFVGRSWFHYLQTQHIGFRIRVKANHTLESPRGAQPILTPFRELAVDQRRVLRAPRRLWGCPVYLAVQRLSATEWLIVASTERSRQPLAEYAQRWSIETLFAALKTRGFRFEDTHLTRPERLERLLALLTLTTLWAVSVGHWAHQHQPIRQKKPSSAHNSVSFATGSMCCAGS